MIILGKIDEGNNVTNDNEENEDEEDKEYRLKLSDLKETLHINPRLNLTKILINEGVIQYSGVDEYLDFTGEYRNCGERGNNNILYYNKKGINVIKKLIDKMNLICETLVYAKKNYYLCKRKRERKRAP